MNITDTIADWGGGVVEFVGQAYAQAPVLVLALSLFLIFPILILIGWLMRPRLESEGGATQLLRPGKDNGGLTGRTAMAGVPPMPVAACIEITNGEKIRLEGREMLRLGREDDNDVCFDEATVHRYHAVIKRSIESGYVISDISESGGNGVFVNGRRTREARLEDGDEINLGVAKITFRSDAVPELSLEH
ncbi:MAG: FHA domain-containing protein [Hyphomicrobiaceae bacterium]